MEEERIMDEELCADSSEVQSSAQSNASNDTPSSPGDSQSSIPEEHLQVYNLLYSKKIYFKIAIRQSDDSDSINEFVSRDVNPSRK
ncbi:hypothetical protein, partial [Corallococcus exiguus]|uniref:hypothetical protein n=1 Tax=Corallococcus exiguus TaxID=83462 RepID=UPI001C26FFEC